MVSSGLNKAAVEAEADLLVGFVNTIDLEEGTDALADPERMADWITDHTGEFVPVPDSDSQARLLALRESVRALLIANNGIEAGEDELEPLREAAERSRYRTTISSAGRIALAPARADLSGFEARLLLALERLQSHGAWPRLKACTNPACHWAFYDTTRNRSRTWCSMEECGNREKTRRYRSRRKTGM
ncbi:MAG TPA: CGNR zinc finger domain-containing protein [Solirubrobacterales bacterium]|nr:CGNR zinc finger domain-containing protein [Solirubrobacterales bacterium]